MQVPEIPELPEAVEPPIPTDVPEIRMPTTFGATNIHRAHNFLTGDGIVKHSGGALQPMTPEAASGLIGGWIVETGSPDLTNLDVVEQNNGGAGRGISQFSHARRGPYDAARDAAIKAGVDPNSIDFQLGYAVDEYTGKHDGNNGSLIGWTNSFQNHGQSTSVEDATRGFTNDYFRPSTPHMDRRIEAANRVYTQMTAPQPVSTPAPTPQPTPPAPRPAAPVIQSPKFQSGRMSGRAAFN